MVSNHHEPNVHQFTASKSDPEERIKFDQRLIVNPETGLIPEGIYSAEREWADAAPRKLGKTANTYTVLGPDNLGGRTRAIAFDVRGADTIIAGGVSSGVFKSTNGGTSWTKVSPDNEIHNVTTIIQDPRSGHQNTWYYAGGEASGNSASSGNTALYMGYGVYKSTDNGNTWSRLTGSNAGALESFSYWSDFVQRLAIDTTTGYIYMACLGSIFRSTNAGSTWSPVLQVSTSSISTSWQSDIIILPSGRMYAAFDGRTSHGGNDYDGIWVSETGASSSWTQIAGDGTPTGWNSKNTYGRVVLAYAPTDTSQIYALYWNGTTHTSGSPSPEAELFKYKNTHKTWTNLSANLPDETGYLSGNDPFACQGGYDLCIAVKPNDTNTVFIGGTNAYRSTDGFTSTSNTTRIGGYASATTYNQYTNHHSDIHTFVFAPGDSNTIYTGSDGGIHKADITVTTPSWTSLNNNYYTYQYYYAVLAPDAYKQHYIGGCQDNGTVRCLNNDASQSGIFSGDGCAVGIAQKDGVYTEFVSVQNGRVFRRTSDLAGGFYNNEITPSGFSSNSAFVTLFHLDPDNNDYLYYANGADLVRNTSATTATTSTGWTNMTGANATLSNSISSFATTRGPYSASTASLFIGTSSANLYRLDDPANAAAGASITDITPTGMTSGVITDISVNPRNDDTIMVVYSNYGVTSIWWTGNANSGSPTWTNVEGNVTLPSVRSCEIVLTSSGVEYYIGTSVGLYSTTTLNGGSTTWSLEGSSTIGYSIVRTMDYRPDDNTLLVGTHGNGLFLADIGNPAEYTVESSANTRILLLGANETKLFKSDDGNAMAVIENLDNFNYGVTTVSIDNTGTSGMDFSTNTGSAQEIMEKTIRITPTNSNSSGNVKITMYFSSAEVSGWKTATGWNAKDLALIKSPVSIATGTQANSVEGTSIVIDSTYNGSNLSITSTFSNGFSGVAAGKAGTGGPLPVTFVDFDLTPIGEDMILNWSTANELNNDRFEVQRQLDGLEWEVIGEVKGNGTTHGLSSYSFTDKNLKLQAYKEVCYKLKQIDFDGAYDFTETRCHTNTNGPGINFVFSPNPVSDMLTLDVDPWADGSYTLSVFDVEGNEVVSNVTIERTIGVDISHLTSGNYFAVLNREGSTPRTFRFIKIQ